MTDAAAGSQNVRVWNGLTIPTAGTLTLDPQHADVSFVARQMMFTLLRGRFTDVAGALVLGADPVDSRIEVVAATASVTTGNTDRDARLRSADFFGADAHPELTFRSTSIVHISGNEFVFAGDLTIRGVTQPVEMRATYDGVGVDPWGAQVVGFSARTEVDRGQWGLTWNATLEAGGILVSRKVVLEIDAEFKRAQVPFRP